MGDEMRGVDKGLKLTCAKLKAQRRRSRTLPIPCA